MTIRNPILPGFNPDPSIVRVGDDYYIATSTFEWFPGVQIHHSRDLVHWRLLTRPLNRASQLNLLGDPDSCGIWAPCLSYSDGLFWLIYTDVKRFGRASVAGATGSSMRDFHNYLVTSPRIEGDWSDPVYLNSSGFDPSLFHENDGRKYLLNMLWDHRPGNNRFAGIVLQEYSVAERKLIGERVNIFSGTPLGFTEAPHLYKRNDWYYLLTAEGGTGWGHAVTMARSRKLAGPYELHPDNHIMSARHRPDAELQRAGHASLVETQNGQTYMVYLIGRPCAIVAAAHSVAKRQYRKCVGTRITGCGRWTDTEFPPSKLLQQICPHIRSHPSRYVKTSTRHNCQSISNGSARPGPKKFSALPHVPVFCGSLAAKQSAVPFASHSWRVGSNPTASARPPSLSSSPNIFSNSPGSFVTTTARNSITSTSRTMKSSVNICA